MCMELAKLSVPDFSKPGLRYDDKLDMLVDCLGDLEKKTRHALNNIELANFTDDTVSMFTSGQQTQVISRGGGTDEEPVEVDWNGILNKPDIVSTANNTVTVMLLTSQWSEGELYTQTVKVYGLLESDHPTVDVDMSSAKTQDDMLALLEAWSSVVKATASDGEITVFMTDVPEIDVPIKIQGVRVIGA